MGFFIVIKIAVVSLLVIYAVHTIWNYYTTTTKTKPTGTGGERINSALRDSKKMYEDMARTIQYRPQHAEIDTSQSTEQYIIPTSEEQPIHMTIEPNKKDMEDELKAFMENIT
jgi:hypothetical protein